MNSRASGPKDKFLPDSALSEITEVTIRVTQNIHDAVCNFIHENFAEGVILGEVDSENYTKIYFYISSEKQTMELVRTQLTEYINSISILNEIRSQSSILDISFNTIKNSSWEQKYRESVKPIYIDNIIVRPPWATISAEDRIELIIEPKMAFGTGSHESTQLCLREILRFFQPGKSFFDLGCGSGILSILAAKLGAEKVTAVDIDPIAVENTLENGRINRVDNKMAVHLGSIEHVRPGEFYDFIVANIIKNTILELFDSIFRTVRNGGTIVLSGLLTEDGMAIENMLANYSVLKYNIIKDGQWIAFNIVKK